MKGEYVEEKDHQNDMFAKLKFQPHHPHQPPPSLHPHHHHHFQLTSDEADNRSPTTPSPSTTTSKKEPTSDGASIEVVRRPRGRPPGSKNKPKPPIFLSREADPSMSPYFLEIPGGADVVDSVIRFCRKNNTGLCVLTASGAVANVSLRQPTTPGATVTFHGRFDLLSLSATIFPASLAAVPAAAAGSGFAISLVGPQGQIFGGTVAGPLFAAATVYVVAASFNNPSFHRLPVEVEVEVDEEVRESGSGGNEGHASPAASGGGDGGHPSGAAAGESCGMSVYSCHVPSDVVWAPTARQPPPPHYG